MIRHPPKSPLFPSPPLSRSDLPVIARPLVKWSFEVHRLADLPRLVHRAAKTALAPPTGPVRSEEHTSELQSRLHLVCRLLLEKKKYIVHATKPIRRLHLSHL